MDVMSCAVQSGLLASAKLCNQLKHKLFVSGCLNYSEYFSKSELGHECLGNFSLVA